MTRTQSLLLKSVSIVLAIPVLAGATLLACWLLIPDEAPDPAAQRLLAPGKAIPPADNLYFAIMGFSASASLDPHQVGVKTLEAFAAWSAQAKPGQTNRTQFDIMPFMGESPFKRPNAFKSPCRAEAASCLAEIDSLATELDSELERSKPWLARYRALRAYPAFSETMQLAADVPIPPWSPILHASDLTDVRIARDMAAAGTRGAALAELAAEIDFYQRLGLNAELLITRMIAAAAMARKLRLASELMTRHPDIVKTHAEAVAGIARPLPPEWTHLRRVADGEFRFMAAVYQNVGRDLSRQLTMGMDNPPTGLRWLESLHGLNAYRPQATLNDLARQMRRIGEFYSRPARDMVDGLPNLRREDDAFNLWSPRTLAFNPVGKTLVYIGQVSWEDYAYRVHDTAGQARLVALQRIAIDAGLKADASADQINRLLIHDNRLFDPYTEKPMQWDAASGELRFSGRNDRATKAGPYKAKLPA